MSDGDVDTSSSADTSFESSMVSKPQTSTLALDLPSTLQPSSSALMFNFLNYDPSCNRNGSNTTSYSSFTYFVCRSLGLGSLCMPYAFKQVGVVIGLLLSFTAGLTFTYSFTLLCRFRYKICQIHREPTVPYQNMIEYGLAHGPRVIRYFSTFFRFTFIAMNLTLNFGKSCLYTKFASLAIQELFTEMGLDVNLLNISLTYEVVCLSFMLLYTDHMKPIYVLSRIVCTILLCFTYYIMFKSDIHIDNQTLSCGNWTDVFQFFGTLLFSVIPVVQVLRIEDGLIKPDNFVKPFNLLNISMAVITNVYIVIGLCAYLNNQDVPIVIGNSVSVLKIIPAIGSRTIIKSCVAANIIFFHRELCLESVLLWSSSIGVKNAKNDEKKHQKPFTAYLSPPFFAGLTAVSKILYTFCSFLVTASVPSPATSSFQAMVALIGYLGNACNMLVYPYAVELCVTYALHGTSTRPYVIAKDVCFVVIGLSVFACVDFWSPADDDSHTDNNSSSDTSWATLSTVSFPSSMLFTVVVSISTIN